MRRLCVIDYLLSATITLSILVVSKRVIRLFAGQLLGMKKLQMLYSSMYMINQRDSCSSLVKQLSQSLCF